ncbi:MAG: prepilin-type N-terminal cleavage/methylation domain-containing protein [Phycisphaerales bacterium]|nr:prepilin-type N-terminal cleavage/methylation domain-containing protein [Phycisphaerales bacterium]
MGVVLAAGLLKAADLAQFADDVRTWELVPRAAVGPLAVGVPLLEIGLGAAWFLGLARRAALGATLAMLVLFTLTFGVHLAFASPPNCGCLGILRQFADHRQAAWMVIARNSLLIGAGWIGLRSVRIRGTARPPVPRSSATSAQPGFTLIETLLVVVLVALLVGLSMPAFRGVILAARVQKDLANLRGHVQIMEMYAGDFADQFPYTTDPRATYTVRRHPLYRPIEIVYFEGDNSWHWPLLDGYYTSAASPSFASTKDPSTLFTDYCYSSSFLADARFWNESTRTGPEQWRSTHLADVTWPSDKGLLVQFKTLLPPLEEQGGPRHVLNIGFVDGSARDVPISRTTRPYPRGEGSWWGSWWFFGVRVLHTVDGVRGRDAAPP